MGQFSLKLFIAGQTARSEHAVAQARRLSESKLAGKCVLEIIDVVERPDIAEQERILATPMLVKAHPLPMRRIIGDLTRMEDVLFGLGLLADMGVLEPGGSA
ncbi:MAG: circadian clock KaiB family protein [Acidobacteria bacterium]|nr:circadian clock KaiB family protein [Acidobacteriota bacterium]